MLDCFRRKVGHHKHWTNCVLFLLFSTKEGAKNNYDITLIIES